MKSLLCLSLVTVALLSACTDPTPPTPPDTTAPSVTLSATPTPISGAGQVKLSATASDNVGVTKVVFYKGAVLLGEDTTIPYEFSDTVAAPLATTTLSYRAVAVDAAGNTAEQTIAVVSQPAAPAPLPSLSVRFSQSRVYAFPDAQGVGRKVSFYARETKNNTLILLAEGTVAADYSLTLSAVTPEQLAPVLMSFDLSTIPAECTSTLQLSDTALKFANSFSFRSDTTGLTISGSSSLYLLNPDGSQPPSHTGFPGGFGNSLFYADRASSVKGQVNCSKSTFPVIATYNMELKKGWNFLQQTYQPAGVSPTSTQSSDQAAQMTYTTLPASAVTLTIGGY